MILGENGALMKKGLRLFHLSLRDIGSVKTVP